MNRSPFDEDCGVGLPPGDPTAGKWIGRVASVTKGQTVGVFDAMVVGRAGELVSVCLTRLDDHTVDSSDPPTLDAPLVALVSFGAGGTRESCQCDWLNGTVLSIPAGSIAISCQFPDTGVLLGLPAADLKQNVGVIAAAGRRPPSAGVVPMARFTDRLGTIAAGGHAVSIVPPRANSVMLFTDDPDSYGSYVLEYRTNANLNRLAVGARTIAKIAPANADETALIASVRSIVLTNNGADAFLSLVYGIAL